MATLSGSDILPFSPLRTALICSDLGWRVFPSCPGTKYPRIKEWPKLATTDHEQIYAWWGQCLNCPASVLTGPESGIWVLDIDVKWCNGFEALRDLFHSRGVAEPPRTLRARTPSGGQQWYFTYPADGRKVQNSTSSPTRPGRLGPGLEVRGWHGQVVAPMQFGRRIICDDLSRVPAPTEAPEWLLDLVVQKPIVVRTAREFVTVVEARHSVERAGRRLSESSRGGRNDELNREAFALGLLGGISLLSEHEARTALYDACLRNGLIADDGEDGFTATFTSGWTAGIQAGANTGERVR